MPASPPANEIDDIVFRRSEIPFWRMAIAILAMIDQQTEKAHT